MTTINPIPDLLWLHRDAAAELGVRGQGGYVHGPNGVVFAPVGAGDPPLSPELAHGHMSCPGPSPKQRAAARKQWRIRAILGELTLAQQHLLELAYMPRQGAMDDQDILAALRGAIASKHSLANEVAREQLSAARELRDEAQANGSVTQQLMGHESETVTISVDEARSKLAKARERLDAVQKAAREALSAAAGMLRAAHGAYDEVARRRKREAKAELVLARSAGQAKREALLFELNPELADDDRKAANRAEARAWMERLKEGSEVA